MNIDMKKNARQLTGRIGEQAAERYLLLNGYEIVDRNWRCKTGEIDLIVSKPGLLIFVEVRSRHQGDSFGTAAESVDERKQRKVRHTAEFYLRRYNRTDSAVRFDLITVELNARNQAVKLDHYRNAF
ncbi:YraN family protein [Paenibacillus senegalensis]|uniref:YraN family protein n=1 Tax=Paenibacillus senegalensis TaxID=1465766 RepID=UPI00028A25AF|nr:YraN family protein [Paenibacillus senegalensis]